MKTNTEISFSFSLTLFYSLSLSQTLWTDRRRETQIHLLCVGWRNLFSFPVVLLCQFFVLVGNRFVLRSTIMLRCCVQFFWFWRETVFGVLYLWYLLYNTVVQLCQFLVLVGNGFDFTYLRTQSTIQLWCCVSFLVLAGNRY